MLNVLLSLIFCSRFARILSGFPEFGMAVDLTTPCYAVPILCFIVQGRTQVFDWEPLGNIRYTVNDGRKIDSVNMLHCDRTSIV